MADNRIASSGRLPQTPAARNTGKIAGPSESQPKVATDSLKTRGPDQSELAKEIAEQALDFRPKPKGGSEQHQWLLEGYSRLLKIEASLDVLKGKDQGDLWFRYQDAKRLVEKHDKNGAAKTEFFNNVLPPAKELIDGLASHPEPPADKAGKEQWLADAKLKLAQAKSAKELFKDAWFEFKAVSFEDNTAVTRKLFDFESRMRRVEYELNPPAPRQPSQPGAPGNAGPGRPLFELTQGASDMANSKNPVGQAVGGVLLPLAVTVDLIDMITRPFQWLDSVSNKK